MSSLVREASPNTVVTPRSGADRINQLEMEIMKLRKNNEYLEHQRQVDLHEYQAASRGHERELDSLHQDMDEVLSQKKRVQEERDLLKMQLETATEGALFNAEQQLRSEGSIIPREDKLVTAGTQTITQKSGRRYDSYPVSEGTPRPEHSNGFLYEDDDELGATVTSIPSRGVTPKGSIYRRDMLEETSVTAGAQTPDELEATVRRSEPESSPGMAIPAINNFGRASLGSPASFVAPSARSSSPPVTAREYMALPSARLSFAGASSFRGDGNSFRDNSSARSGGTTPRLPLPSLALPSPAGPSMAEMGTMMTPRNANEVALSARIPTDTISPPKANSAPTTPRGIMVQTSPSVPSISPESQQEDGSSNASAQNQKGGKYIRPPTLPSKGSVVVITRRDKHGIPEPIERSKAKRRGRQLRGEDDDLDATTSSVAPAPQIVMVQPEKKKMASFGVQVDTIQPQPTKRTASRPIATQASAPSPMASSLASVSSASSIAPSASGSPVVPPAAANMSVGGACEQLGSSCKRAFNDCFGKYFGEAGLGSAVTQWMRCGGLFSPAGVDPTLLFGSSQGEEDHLHAAAFTSSTASSRSAGEMRRRKK